MSSSTQAFGLRPIRHRNGAPYNGAFSWYCVPSTDSTALYIGDAVVRATYNAYSPDGYPYVKQHTAADTTTVGVVVGFAEPVFSDEVYRVASTQRMVMVADDPDLIFEILSSASMSATQTGNHGDIVVGTASTITGLSGMTYNASDGTGRATLKFERLKPAPDNQWGNNDAHMLLEVSIVEHLQRTVT